MKILLIEDEPGLVLTLTDRLQSSGYEVDSATHGEEGYQKALRANPDLVLLDVMLPDRNGFEICRDLREQGFRAPILMITARGEVVDKVVGLRSGADDYLVKPFDTLELLARIEALLRRSASAAPAANGFEFSNVRIDWQKAEVYRGGEQVTLSAREFQLLRYLIDHSGQVVARDQILQDVWGYQSGLWTRTLDVHVAWLRQKVEENPKYPRHLITVRGVGYRFDP
jgi:two-component system alkaline phosphatase synthesis response regulator PhoP